MTNRFIVLKVMTHRESQYSFQTIEYFYMERVTFVKTSLLPSKNDEFRENAHFFYKKLPLFIKNSILHTYKKLKPQV